MADRLEHAPHLVLPAFVQGELDTAAAEAPDLRRGSETVVELDAFAQATKGVRRWVAFDLRDIHLLDAVARVREPVSEVAVVREQERTGRIRIETTDGDDARRAADEIDHGSPTVRIARGRDETGRLVQKDVREPLRLNPLPVDLDAVACADVAVQAAGLAVDGHATSLDQLVGATTRGDAGASEKRVEPHAGSIRPVGTPGRDERSRYFVSAELPALLRQRAESAPPAVLADLGAGEGAMLYALDQAGFVGSRILAVDLSGDALAVAASLSPRVTAIVADATHVAEIGDAEVDAVVSSQVIEHLPDDRALAFEIARILRPGGWFYVSSVVRGRRAWWFRRGSLGRQLDPTHVREYSSEGAFVEALGHPQLTVDEVRSQPLRFSAVDPVVRAAAARGLIGNERLVTLFERNRALALTRRVARVRVPGYRWVEAVGRRLT